MAAGFSRYVGFTKVDYDWFTIFCAAQHRRSPAPLAYRLAFGHFTQVVAIKIACGIRGSVTESRLWATSLY